MKNKLVKPIILIFILTVASYCVYKYYFDASKPLEVSKYKQFKITFDHPIIWDSTTKENIIIKDKNDTSIDCYVFLSTDKKSIIVNPPIVGYYPENMYSIVISRNIHFEDFQLKKNKIISFNVLQNNEQAPIKVRRSPKPGDIIGVSGEFMGYKYDHYGLYIGNNRVIHYYSKSGKAADSEIIETDTNKYFGDKYFILDLKTPSQFNTEEAIKRAKERLGEKSYDLLENNCEDFAIWCKTDESKSFQVNSIPQDQIPAVKEFMTLGFSLQ